MTLPWIFERLRRRCGGVLGAMIAWRPHGYTKPMRKALMGWGWKGANVSAGAGKVGSRLGLARQATRGIKRIIGVVSPSRSGRSVILLYHSVGSPFPASIPVAEFRRQMESLQQNYHVVSILELMARVQAGETGLAAVTFDDGYSDCYEQAFPILNRLSIPFALFVATAFVERGECDFGPEYSELPALTWPQILEMQRHGALVGGHTHTHIRWSTQSTRDLRLDLHLSKRILEQRTGSAITAFAYPFGQPHDFDGRAPSLLREAGFSQAFTTLHTTFRRCPEPFLIPRITINACDTFSEFVEQTNGKRDLIAFGQTLRSKTKQWRRGEFTSACDKTSES
jgi:peptidoglycan/xylan/chitin deacetylase (PgdA/CDA1 family)